jgi:hypothetical protein
MAAAVGAVVWATRQAAGRMAPKMALAPLLFLISRWPVLAAWAVGAVGMYVLLTTSAAANGKDPGLAFSAGLSLFCGLGFAALVVGPTWIVVRALAPKTTFELEEGETIRAKNKANHMLGREARGGELLVTDRRLGFRPHRFNVQLDNWSLPFDQILRTRVEGTRLVVLDTTAGEEILVAPDPDGLLEVVQAQIGRP